VSAPPALAEVTAAVVTMLRTALGKPVGDGQAPPDGVESQGYAVVHVIPGGYSYGDLGHPDGQTSLVIQVSYVGITRIQAQQGADRCRAAILGRVSGTGAFTCPINTFAYNLGGSPKSLSADVGVQVWHRSLDMDGGVDAEGPLFNAIQRYELAVGPT
jgi:hypothetical protein